MTDNYKIPAGAGRAMEVAERQAYNEGGKALSGLGLILGLSLVCVLIVILLTYVPGQIDESYSGGGQVISMVNPSGDDPDMDAQYAEINQGNALANLINARAYQRQSVIWLAWVFGFAAIGFGLLALTRKRE